MREASLPLSHLLKMYVFGRGIMITPIAQMQLSQGGKKPVTIHEYVTTGGVNLIVDEHVYINAPFDEWFCVGSEAVLDFDSDDGYFVTFRGARFRCQVLPLPGYLDLRNSKGSLVRETVMSHADRARISPIYGCAFGCKFCDLAGKKYVRHGIEQILEDLEIAKKDKLLPAKHVLISGGTPSPKDYDYFDEVCRQVICRANLPVDVMMTPREDDIIERLIEWGVYGFAINLEIYDREIAQQITPQKQKKGLDSFAKSIERALQLTGGKGRVRSLLLVGLEPPEKTLEGVTFLAKLGCDPVLSPFRPARGIALQNVPPPTTETLEYIYLESLNIVEHYGVKLGPRCIPCQHNTLTFPDNTGEYYYS